MADSAPLPTSIQGSLMRGKRGLIMGVANDRSLGWGVAAACAAQGAQLAFTFQGEALERRVRPLAASVGSDLVFPCDVTDEASIDAAFEMLRTHWDGLDFTYEQFQELQTVDRDAWRKEVMGHEELFLLVHDHLPPEMIYERELLICRL